MKIFSPVLMIAFTSTTVFAITTTPVSEQPLLSSCEALSDSPKQKAASLCNHYMQGYIAGTLAIDEANAIELAEASRDWSAFMERVYHTRIGAREGRNEASRFLHFCIAEGAPENVIIDRLSAHLTPPIKTIEGLRERLYHALKSEYPCG